MTQRVASVLGVGGFRDSVNYFEGSSNAPAGSDTMSRIVVLQVLSNNVVVEWPWANDNASTRGWSLQITAGVGFRWIVGTGGGGGNVIADVAVDPTSSVFRPGTVLIWQVSFDSAIGSNVLLNGVSASAGPNGAFVDGVRDTTAGVRPNNYGTPLTSYGIVALFATDTVSVTPTSAVETYLAEQIANGRDLSGLSTFWSNPSDFLYYDARDVVIDGSEVEASWSPRVGPSIPLTTNGRPTAFDTPGRLLT